MIKPSLLFFILRKGVLVLHFKYNNNEPNLKSKSNQTNIITLILGQDRINCYAVVDFYFMQRDRRCWRDTNSLGRLFINSLSLEIIFYLPEYYENMLHPRSQQSSWYGDRCAGFKDLSECHFKMRRWVQLNPIYKFDIGHFWKYFGGSLPLFSCIRLWDLHTRDSAFSNALIFLLNWEDSLFIL